MTDIKKTPIPQRLKNVSADHPYVAGAVDIVDDRLGNNQERVNEALQNGINALDSQNYYYAEATDQTSDVTDILPASGAADTLYRVASWDGEQYDATVYSEYAWDGTGYQILDVKEPGIDEEPAVDSVKLVKSGGVRDSLDTIYRKAVEDKNRIGFSYGRITSEGISTDVTYAILSSLITRTCYVKLKAGYIIKGTITYDKGTGEVLTKSNSTINANEGLIQSGNSEHPYNIRFNILKEDSAVTDVLDLTDDYIESIEYEPADYRQFGLFKQGYASYYWHRNDSTRVSMTLDAINQGLWVKTVGNVFIASVISDPNTDDAEITSYTVKSLYVPCGHVYNIVFKKSSGSISIADIEDKVLIGHNNDAVQRQHEDILGILSKHLDYDYGQWYTTTVGEAPVVSSVSNTQSILIDVSTRDFYLIVGTGGKGGRLWATLDNDGNIVRVADTEKKNDYIKIETGEVQLLAQSNSVDYFGLYKIDERGVIGNVFAEIDNNSQLYPNEYKPQSANLYGKLSKLLAGDNIFVNITFIGDSWTQGVPYSGVTPRIQRTYAKNLASLLQDQYGYGGLGWIDFATDSRDRNNNNMFGACDGYESFSYSFSGTTSHVDGSEGPDYGENCLGICCAHTVFGDDASLMLSFAEGKLDKFKIRYYKDAKFSVAINGGSPTVVTANSTDGWQETEFGTTGTDILTVVITSLADDTIIFGMDCYYGSKGIRCNKVGNRSVKAAQYLNMDEEQWEGGIRLLDSSWTSVCLAINDVGSSTNKDKVAEVIDNINEFVSRIITANTDVSDNLNTDISLISIDAIENNGYKLLPDLSEAQRVNAFNNKMGYVRTGTVIGYTSADAGKYSLFQDTIHLNETGCDILARHILNALFGI